jgi:hypothetical protein
VLGDERKEEELWRRFGDKMPDGMVIDNEQKVCADIGDDKKNQRL